MLRRIPLALAAFLSAAPCYGQQAAAYYSGQATVPSRAVSPGQSAPLLTLPYAQVSVCYTLANAPLTCNSAATVYGDPGLTQPLAQPIVADVNGNYGFFALPGLYAATIVSAQTSQQTVVPLMVTGQGPAGTASVVTSNGAQGNFYVTGNLTANQIDGTVYATGYGAKCDNTADDTVALQAAITAAKTPTSGGVLHALQLPPGICRTSQTLDFTGLSVNGTTAGLSSSIGRNSDTLIVPTSANPGFDMVQTSGYTHLANVGIGGGWDGSTKGLNGNGFTSLTGYNNSLDNVTIQAVAHDGVYLVQPAYQSFHNLSVLNVGHDDMNAVSYVTPGFQTTTVALTGKTVLDAAPNGYSLECQSCVSITTSGGFVTAEATHGVKITGIDNRNLNFSNWYFENTLPPIGTTLAKCFDFAGSSGIGLLLNNNYGPACFQPTSQDLSTWGNVTTQGGNDMAGQDGFTDHQNLRLGSAFPNIDFSTQFTTDVFVQTSWTNMNISSAVPQVSGVSWAADITGTWVDYTARPRPEATIHLSSAHPSVMVGDRFLLTCQINGQFQCQTSNYAPFVSTPEFMGFIRVTNDKTTSNSGVYFDTGDIIGIGGLNVISGTSTLPGFSGQCNTPIFTNGVATGCAN